MREVLGSAQTRKRRAMLARLRMARDLMDQRYAEPIDLDMLAVAAGLSRYHFNRRFAKVYGQTPMRYLVRRRIERAQDLLRRGDVTVTDVCMQVGFASLGSFSSRFRALVGESPSRYRARWAGRGGLRIPACFLFMRGIDSWRCPEEPREDAQSRRSARADDRIAFGT